MATPAAIRPSIGGAAGAALHSCRAATGLGIAAARPTTALPPLSHPSRLRTAGLSTTAALLKRHTYDGARDNADHNRQRGESAIRRTGPRWKLSVSGEPLPRPVRALPAAPENDPAHGLWDFFQDRSTVAAGPVEDAKHGRGWMVEELRGKSWEDLHMLWWVCVKERNRLATAKWERDRQKLGYGENEFKRRDEEVKVTMRGIKHVLTERQYAWEDAVELAQQDPEIDMSGEGPLFTPSSYLDAPEEASPEEEAKNAALRRLAADARAAKEAAAAEAPPASGTVPPREQEGQKEAPRI